MDDTKQATIKLVVKDEDDLYSPFSPDDELSDAVKQYIKTKAGGIEYNRIIDLTVISRDHLDEEKFRRAVKSWIRDEKAVNEVNQKNTLNLMFKLLLFGSIMIIASIYIVKKNTLLQYSLLPIIGSLSLSRAVHKMIIEYPIVLAERKIIESLEKNSTIIFDYTEPA